MKITKPMLLMDFSLDHCLTVAFPASGEPIPTIQLHLSIHLRAAKINSQSRMVVDMDDLVVAIILLVGIPVGAATSVAKAFGLLAYYRPLQVAILGWLTEPQQSSTLQSQYVIIRSKVYGNSIVSLKRSVMIGLCFFTIFLIISAFAIDAIFHDSESESFIYLASRMYSFWYFHIWYVMPMTSLIMLIIAFFLSHFSFSIFDLITVKIWSFGNNLALYVLIIMTAYLSILIIIALLVSFIPYLLFGSHAGSLSDFIHGWLTAIPTNLAILKGPHEDDDWSGVFSLGALVAMGGTALICFSAIIAVTFLNLLYAFSLGLMNADYLLRVKLNASQNTILSNPVGYIAYAMGFVVFVVVAAGEFIWMASLAVLR